MRAARVALIVCAVVGVGCAAKVEPSLPSTLAYPDFLYPVATPASADQVAAIDHAWRLLQTNALDLAEGEFAALAVRRPDLPAARVGQGYVAVARRDDQLALARFGSALARAPAYVPALVGQVLVCTAALLILASSASYWKLLHTTHATPTQRSAP